MRKARRSVSGHEKLFGLAATLQYSTQAERSIMGEFPFGFIIGTHCVLLAAVEETGSLHRSLKQNQ